MLYGAQTGENSALSPYKIALNDGDIVELMITNICLPFTYQNKIEEINKKIEEDNNKSGIMDDKVEATYKEGGLALEVVALEKVNTDGIVTDYSDSFATEKGIYTTITMPTPIQFLDRGFDLKDVRRGGKVMQGPKGKPFIGVFSKEGNVIIDDIYPSPNIQVHWHKGEIVKTADDITDDDLLDEENGAAYTKVVAKEKMRKEGWIKMKRLWENWTEIECRNFLMLAMSSRFLLYDKDAGKGAEYYMPKVGMRFSVKVNRKVDKEGKLSKYINFLSCEWNSLERGWDYYSTGTTLPSEDDILLAEDIRAQQLICYSS